MSSFAGRAELCDLGRIPGVIPGGISLEEIVPEYIECFGADRFKQPQIGFRCESFKRQYLSLNE